MPVKCIDSPSKKTQPCRSRKLHSSGLWSDSCLSSLCRYCRKEWSLDRTDCTSLMRWYNLVCQHRCHWLISTQASTSHTYCLLNSSSSLSNPWRSDYSEGNRWVCRWGRRWRWNKARNCRLLHPRNLQAELGGTCRHMLCNGCCWCCIRSNRWDMIVRERVREWRRRTVGLSVKSL